MNPEEKKLLEDTFKLSEENNKLLHSIRGHMRVQRFISILYWVFIIGSAVGAFYLIQPYIDEFTGAYSGASEAFKNFGN